MSSSKEYIYNLNQKQNIKNIVSIKKKDKYNVNILEKSIFTFQIKLTLALRFLIKMKDNLVLNIIKNENNVLKTIKDFHQTMTKQLDIMSFPSLKEFLGTRYGESSSGEKCEFCGRSCKNYAALKAHHRGCKKENVVLLVEPMIQEVDEVLPENNEFTNMNLSQLKEECKKRNINTSGKKKEDLLKSLN